MAYKDVKVEISADFKDLSDYFSYIVSQTDKHVLKEEDIKYWEEALKGMQPRPIHYEYNSPPKFDWSDLKIPIVPFDWSEVNTASSNDIIAYTFPPKSNTYHMVLDTYSIDITYDMLNDWYDIVILFKDNSNTIEHNHITKEHLELLFDPNNLLYKVDNVILCTQCGKVIIDNQIVYEHKTTCIANILDDLERYWHNIKRI